MRGRVAFVRCACIGFALAALFPFLPPPTEGGTPDAEVLPPGVYVLQAPTPGAAVVRALPAGARVEVLFTQSGPGGSWSQILLPSGQTGFAPETSLRRLTSAPQWRSAGASSAPPRAARRVGDDVLEVSLQRLGGVLLVASRINSQVTTNFIVDTGASVVTISHALANRLGIEYASKPTQRLITPSGIMHSPRVVLDVVHVPDETGAGVMHVDAVVATLPGSPPEIGGLLGQSFLRHFHVAIDAERAVLHLQSAVAAGRTYR
jgi:aspartyl protease family protein